MGTEEKAALTRVGRSTVAVIVAEAAKVATASPYGILIIPILSGLGKFLRAKFGWSWLPF